MINFTAKQSRRSSFDERLASIIKAYVLLNPKEDRPASFIERDVTAKFRELNKSLINDLGKARDAVLSVPRSAMADGARDELESAIEDTFHDYYLRWAKEYLDGETSRHERAVVHATKLAKAFCRNYGGDDL